MKNSEYEKYRNGQMNYSTYGNAAMKPEPRQNPYEQQKQETRKRTAVQTEKIKVLNPNITAVMITTVAVAAVVFLSVIFFNERSIDINSQSNMYVESISEFNEKIHNLNADIDANAPDRSEIEALIRNDGLVKYGE